MRLLFIAAGTALLAWPQSDVPDVPKGAKALFFSPDSGRQTPIAAPAPIPGSNGKGHSVSAPVNRLSGTSAIIGLRYYVELRQPEGSLLRVNTKHVFHSGDRIRLHVETNVDGDLVIYQKQEGEQEERLFPAAEIAGATGRVTHGSDTVLPTAHAWFQFDDHPGQIHLTLMVTAQSSQADLGADAQERNKTATADLAHKIAGATSGSKGLRIQTDDSPDDKAEYKVIDSRLDPKLPAGIISTEITLSHAR